LLIPKFNDSILTIEQVMNEVFYWLLFFSYEQILLITEPVFQRYEIPLCSHGRHRRADSLQKLLIIFFAYLKYLPFESLFIFVSFKIPSYPMILWNFHLYSNQLNQESLLNVGN
jgi:hypothetical protein